MERERIISLCLLRVSYGYESAKRAMGSRSYHRKHM